MGLFIEQGKIALPIKFNHRERTAFFNLKANGNRLYCKSRGLAKYRFLEALEGELPVIIIADAQSFRRGGKDQTIFDCHAILPLNGLTQNDIDMMTHLAETNLLKAKNGS